MSLRALTIGHRDGQLHGAFCRYVRRVFPEVDFGSWIAHGGWSDERYLCVALAEGDEIVANVSLTRVALLVEGRAHVGVQLGAVGVVPSFRGRGLARRVMDMALAQLGDAELAFLFANKEVLGFYPRFGFRQVAEHIFGFEAQLAPAGTPLPRLNIEREAHRALLARLSEQAKPVATTFGATDYGDVLLWYWANFYPDGLYYSSDDDAIVIAEQHGTSLRVLDVVAAQSIDLLALLPRIVRGEAVRRVELGFSPDFYGCARATLLHRYDDSPLFVRGALRLPERPFKYPMLAQT